MLFRLFDQSHGFDRQHREHTRHQIQDQAAQKGEKQQNGQRRLRWPRGRRLHQPLSPRGRRDALFARGLSTAGAGKAGGDFHGYGQRILASLFRCDQQAANRTCLRRLIAHLHRQLDAIPAAGQCLRSGVLDAALVIGEKRQ
jgi:hypothetical protein